jgi:hypothetical protein
MQEAFLRALAQRTAGKSKTTVMLPTGPADIGDVAQVVHALRALRQGEMQ